MNHSLRLYRLITSALFYGVAPPIWLWQSIMGSGGGALSQRLGRYRNPKPAGPIRIPAGHPRIWIHAASVGEVRAALPIMAALKHRLPHCSLILSVFTIHGLRHAISLVKQHPHLTATTCLLAPIDVEAAVQRALSAVRPDLLVCMETEIWPNWLTAARRRGIKTALINGRISDRTIKGYLLARPVIQATLASMSAFSMIGNTDADRIQRLGAPGDRITVNGNAKFDLAHKIDRTTQKRLQARYALADTDPVWVAGSTRGTENEIVLGAYSRILQRVPAAVLILAPRHLKKVRQIKALLEAHGLGYQLASQINNAEATRTAPVVLVDTMGELQAIYALASVVFCGGSLVPLGGQNVLEPAAWGKPVLYGPSMGDFRDAKQRLDRAGGGLEIRDEQDLARVVIDLLLAPAEASRMGARARKVVTGNRGAADRHAAVIAGLFKTARL